MNNPPIEELNEYEQLLIDDLRKEDFTRKVVVLYEDAMADAYKDYKWRIVCAAGGSGCIRGAGGSAVFVQFHDRSEAAFRLNHVQRLASAGETKWFHEQWEAAKTPEHWL